MPYEPDLTKITLTEYQNFLTRIRLTPGRVPLRERIGERFAALRQQGIQTLAQLKKALASPTRIERLAGAAGIPQGYLILLKRELGSLEPKLLPLESFAGAENEQIAALIRGGIKTSRAYYESDPPQRGELYALCDLTRINGVGVAAARAFYAAGYRSARAVADADAETLLAAVTAANRDGRYYGAKLGLADMQFCMDYAPFLFHTP